MKARCIRSSISLLQSRLHRQEFSSKAFLLEKTTIRKDLPNSTQRYFKKVSLFNFHSFNGEGLFAARELSLWDRIFGNEDVTREASRTGNLYDNFERELSRSSRRQSTIPIITKTAPNSTHPEASTSKNNSSNIKQPQTRGKDSGNSHNLSDLPFDEFWDKQNQEFQEKIQSSRPKEKVWKDTEADPFIGKPSSFQEPASYTDQLDDRQYEGSREIPSSKSRLRDRLFKRRFKSNDNNSRDEKKSNSQRFESAEQFPSTDQFWDSQNDSFQQQIKQQRSYDPPTWNDEIKDPWKPDKSYTSPFRSDSLPSNQDDRSERNPQGFNRFSSVNGKEAGAAVAIAALVIGLVYMLAPYVKQWLHARRNSRNVYRITDRVVDLSCIPKHLQVYQLIPITPDEADLLKDQEIVVAMANIHRKSLD